MKIGILSYNFEYTSNLPEYPLRRVWIEQICQLIYRFLFMTPIISLQINVYLNFSSQQIYLYSSLYDYRSQSWCFQAKVGVFKALELSINLMLLF